MLLSSKKITKFARIWFFRWTRSKNFHDYTKGFFKKNLFGKAFLKCISTRVKIEISWKISFAKAFWSLKVGCGRSVRQFLDRPRKQPQMRWHRYSSRFHSLCWKKIKLVLYLCSTKGKTEETTSTSALLLYNKKITTWSSLLNNAPNYL